MRIFLTGATGFIGSRLVPELISAGHQVLGLARNDAGADWLMKNGAEAHRGNILDLESLRRGASQCDGVIHTAFDHNFHDFAANCENDSLAILALGEPLRSSPRPLVITSTTAVGIRTAGEPATENYFNPASLNPRKASELAGLELLEQGINLSVVRLSQIHDPVRQGLVTDVVALARESGVSAYVGDGLNRWSAAHVSDAVQLFKLAVEAGTAGARYHATAESGIAFKEIAEVIGARLGIPVVSLPRTEAQTHFGWLSEFVGRDMSSSSEATRVALNWTPRGPGLLTSLRQIPR